MSPRVVLVGPPGAGKTTIGRLLAQRWQVGFRDTDDDVEGAAGSSVSDIFVEQGEEAFRALERAAVRAALDEHDGVLALGGGAVMDEGTREALAGLPVAFLDVGVKDAAKRVGLARDRPLLLGNPRAQWLLMMEKRRPIYEQLASVVVSTDDRAPEEAVEEIAAWLGDA